MPHLIYWFDSSASDSNDCILLESIDFVCYEVGERAALDQIPKHIQEKLILGRERPEEDQRVMNYLGMLRTVLQSDSKSPFTVVPDYELLSVTFNTSNTTPLVPITENERAGIDTISSITVNTTCAMKEQKAADALLAMSTASNAAAHPPTAMPIVGDRISIWWANMKQFFDGCVIRIRRGFYLVHYDDSDEEWLPLDEVVFHIIPPTVDSASSPNSRQAAEDDEWIPSGTMKALHKKACTAITTMRQPYKKLKNEFNQVSEGNKSKTKKPLLKFHQQVGDTNMSKAKKSKLKCRKQQTLHSQGGSPIKKLSTSLASRSTSDGSIRPNLQPARDKKGLYTRPCGRHPEGYSWNGRKCVWVPSHFKVCKNKRKQTQSNDTRPTNKPAKPSHSSDSSARQNNCEDNDDESFLFAQSTNDENWWEQGEGGINRSSMPAAEQVSSERTQSAAALALQITDPVSEDVAEMDYPANLMTNLDKELQLYTNKTGVEATGRVHGLLQKLNRIDVPYSHINVSLIKPVKKLRKHPSLGNLAKSLIEKYQAAYYAELIGSWQRAVVCGDAVTAAEMLKGFYLNVVSSTNPISEALLEDHNLRSLLVKTSHLFHKSHLFCAELDALHGMIDRDIEMSAEI